MALSRGLTTAIGWALVALVSACLWDSDTLAAEAKGLPEALRIITGRFERNPPLYFQMRRDRVSKQIQKTPTKLDLYDDAAVASDRLGDFDQAIEWMRRKRAVLTKLDPKGARNQDWYRTEANEGTFWFHRWLKSGAPKDRIAEGRKGLAHIERAVRINPDAHFGREWVQIAAMRWVIDLRDPKPKHDSMKFRYRSLADAISEVATEAGKREQVVEAAGGLIVLGAAWQSPDFFGAYSELLTYDDQGVLGYLAALRREEILQGGAKELEGNDFKPSDRMPDGRHSTIRQDFTRLRAEADDWHARRTAFMEERLKQGRHPDTDPGFWQGWSDGTPPAIQDNSALRAKFQNPLYRYTLYLFLGVAAAITAIVWIVRRFLRWRRATRTA